MITAEKARERSIATFEEGHKEFIREIGREISEAAQKGNFGVRHQEYCNNAEYYIDYLRAKGFSAWYNDEDEEFIISWN